MKTIIKMDKVLLPIGPYNQAVAVQGRLVFTAGQLPIDPVTGQIASGGIREQTKQVCENLKTVLAQANTTLSNVVKTTVFLKNMGDFAAMNETYGTYFGEACPARSTVEVARLPKDVLVEIEAIAVVE
ncbi:MAG TPA: RidA family protein [Bacteroidota bacterium]|nr:RidA family protein [Bacteroidota bacterium]